MGVAPASVMVWSAAHWLTSRPSCGLKVKSVQPEPPPNALPMPENSAAQRAWLPKSRSIAWPSLAPGMGRPVPRLPK